MASCAALAAFAPAAAALGAGASRRRANLGASSKRVGVVVVKAHGHGHGGMEAAGGGAPASTATAGHGHGHGGGARRPGENKGFVEEMRFIAMKMHTPQQAKEGEKKAEPIPEQQPMKQWSPTKEGYLKFLVESRVMYQAMEEIMLSGSSPMYASFVDTGLERTAPLAKDIAWFEETYGMTAPTAEGAGLEYAAFLKDLSVTNPPEFICHFYNVYFAHSAGGKMIGRKVSEMLLNGKELEFYKWERGLDDSLTHVKSKLNEAAEGWSREEKDRCLEETGKSFKLSGQLLRLLA